jgi:pimeloyl-ACP methyl ester carboxylesterase
VRTVPPAESYGGSVDGDVGFGAAYDAVLRRWPVEFHGVDVSTPYGSTRVQVCGPEDGAPLVLLPGGGTTSAVWFGNVGVLARTHRVHAVDLMGDIGRSVAEGTPLRGADDLTAWLDALHLDRAHLCGHSYGAWIALRYALRAPHRIDRLALLDPTNCFAGMSPRYVAHALPVLLGPSADRARAFHRWETGGAPEDPVWRDFLAAAATARRAKVVAMRRPRPREVRACAVPTLVVLAGRSRAHRVPRVAAAARRLLPTADVVVLPTASHHSLPTERPAELNRLLGDFLA